MSTTSARRSLLAGSLRADLPALVDGVVSTIREQIPAYRQLDGAQTAEVSAIASWGIERILALWVDGGELAEADVRRFQGIGAARALDGRPLGGVLRAYRLAGTRLTDLIAERGADSLAVGDAFELARLWMSAIDTLSEAIYAGYSAASERLVLDRDRAMSDLLDDLLVGRQVTVNALADRTRQLGLVLPPSLVVLVADGGVDAVDDDATVLRGARDDQVVMLLSTVTPALLASLREQGRRCCHVVAPTAHRVPQAYELARHALGATDVTGGRAELGDGDALVLAALRGRPEADAGRLVTSVLGGLVEPASHHLRAGLGAFLATGSATQAAERLGLHAQTMRYRLRRVESVTGRSVRDPWDRFVLQAALAAA